MIKRNLAVLVGNGLSIAFNPELALDLITKEVMRRIANDHDGGSAVVAAMRAMAEHAVDDDEPCDDDFERLVGALGHQAQAITLLEGFTAAASHSGDEALCAVQALRSLVEHAQQRGVGHVLEVIMSRSRFRGENAVALTDLIGAWLNHFDGRIVVANLNYDTLLLAGLLQLCQNDLADLGDPRDQFSIELGPGVDGTGFGLRTRVDDLPSDRRVWLAHPHGSLTYWANRDRQFKLNVDELRDHQVFERLRQGELVVRPRVVLTTPHDKAHHVQEEPFKIGYSVMAKGLRDANYWLIVGYSFKDGPVNKVLAEEFALRDPKPRVHVVTYGEEPSKKLIRKSLGWSKKNGSVSRWLSIDREGALRAEKRRAWEEFVSQ